MTTPVELSSLPGQFQPTEDRRARLPVPPPVQLIVIADVTLSAINGMERALDGFYEGVLRFERDPANEHPVYKAAKFAVRFEWHETPPTREDYRPLGVGVPSLPEVMQRLVEAEIGYTYQRGLTPGMDSLLCADPAGNPIEIFELRAVG